MNNKDKVSIIFTGDLAFSGKFNNKDVDIVDEKIIEFLNSSENVIANVECPITDKGVKSTRALNHFMNSNTIESLKKMNINYINIGNNHIMDCGSEGLEDTLKYAKNNDIKTIGANINKKLASEVIIIDENIKIGVLSLVKELPFLKSDNNTPGCIFYTDIDVVKKQIKKLKEEKCNYIIAIIHAGNEFSSLPMEDVRKKYIEILNIGVDIIIGHHPHVVQNYEKFDNNKIIFYSLGNFIFDTDYQRNQNHTDIGMLIKLTLSKSDYSFESFPIKIDRINSKIIPFDDIPIFTNINENDYKKLYPLCIRRFIKNKNNVEDFKKIKKSKSVNKLSKLKRYFRFIKNKNDRVLFKYKLISYFIRYKNYDENLIKYIMEKI